MFGRLHRLLPVLFIGSGALSAVDLVAQTPATLRNTGMTVAKSAEDLLYAALIDSFASAEVLLHNVTGITDTQRDQIEAFEAGARDVFFRKAQFLREVRRTVMRGWPADPDTYEGPLNMLVEKQQRFYTQIAAVLTSTQRRQLPNAVIEEARDRSFHVWNVYMKGYATAGAVNPALQPH